MFSVIYFLLLRRNKLSKGNISENTFTVPIAAEDNNAISIKISLK